MSIIARIAKEFDGGGGGITGKIGYIVIMTLILTMLLPVSLVLMPFFKLVDMLEKRREVKTDTLKPPY